jgi:hypothetical protein
MLVQLLILARKHTHRSPPAALLWKGEERSRMIRPSEASTSDSVSVTTDSDEYRNLAKIFNRAKKTGSKVCSYLPLVPADSHGL